MAGCFQLDSIENEPLRVNVPPLIEMKRVDPTPDSVVKFYLGGGPATFRIPVIMDGNGFGEDELYGRWWVDYDPTTTSASEFPIFRSPETEETDAGTEEERPFCPGCYWEASFTVTSTSGALDQEGCHQILAVISDSGWDPCVGSMCTDSPTILARVTWWVWVTPEGGDLPTVDECADVGGAVNDPP